MLSMRIARTLALAGFAVGALSATPVRAQFEGAVTIRMTPRGEHATPPMDVTYLIRQGLTRVEFTAPTGQSFATIMDPKARTMMSIMPQQKMYMVMNYGDMADSMSGNADKNVKVTRTGKMETVAGKSCEHVLIQDEEKQVDVCGATGMGTFMGMGAPGRGARGMASQPAWVKDLVKEGFFPLKMTSPEMVWEVTKIEPKSLDASLFAPPAGYQKMDMGSMMRPQRP